MNKAGLFLSIIFCAGLVSCSDDDDGCPPVPRDFINYSVSFLVTGPEGVNLLEDITEDSFIWNVSAEYGGRTYVYDGSADERVTRANKPRDLQLRVEDHPVSGVRCLTFGEFSPTENLRNKKITVDWGTGDDPVVVTFTLYTVEENCDVKVRSSFTYGDGTEIDDPLKDLIPIELYSETERN